jgi:ATP adenylyltransferase
MKRLWEPWRIQYIEEMGKEEGCIFCIKPKENDDEKNLILYRGSFSFIIVNIYPYNSGHLMVAPYRHIGNYEELTADEILEMDKLIKASIRALKKLLKPDGFNIGINVGRAAGAGFDQHIHVHLVPRWVGDTNFMPVIGDTKVIPEELKRTYDKLKPVINEFIR